MSKIICSAAIRGAHKIIDMAEASFEEAVKKFGAEHEVAYPNTAYFLPIIYSMLGAKVKNLGDMKEIFQECRKLLPPQVSDNTWLPYLGQALDAGMATFFAEEMYEAIRYLNEPNFYTKTEDPTGDNIWLGAADDVIFRKRGVEFVDGTAPGFAAIVGAPPTKEIASKIALELQEKNLYIFMHDHTGGVRMPEQLIEAGVQVGWNTRLVPFGQTYTSAVFAIGFAQQAVQNVKYHHGARIADVCIVVNRRPAHVHCHRWRRQRRKLLDATGQRVIEMEGHGDDGGCVDCRTCFRCRSMASISCCRWLRRSASGSGKWVWSSLIPGKR